MKSIIFLLPAFISINYGKEKKSINEMLIEYGVYCCAINLLMLLMLIMIGRNCFLCLVCCLCIRGNARHWLTVVMCNCQRACHGI